MLRRLNLRFWRKPLLFHLGLLVCIPVLTLGSVIAHAQEFRYHYVSLNEIELPPGFTVFSPGAIHNSGRVYGTICDDFCSDPHIAIYEDGTLTVFEPSGFAGPINAGGVVGGSVLVDPVNFLLQAALFRGDEVELIPPQPGEVFSFVLDINDPGTALVESINASGESTFVLYENGESIPLDFGPTITNPSFLSINNRGLIAGRTGASFTNARGFRFDPQTDEITLLDPVPPDTLAWGLSINNRGDVLGYSFVNASTYHERIGVWDRKGNFTTYFDQTISTNSLLFNDHNLIVITLVNANNNSYLVPKPGVRLNIADLVENLPDGADLDFIQDINNHGDMIGSGALGSFLLERK